MAICTNFFAIVMGTKLEVSSNYSGFVDVTVDVRLSYNPFTKEWAVWRSDETVDALAAELQDKI